MNTSVDSNYGKHNFNNELGTQLMLNSLVTSSRFVRWIIWQAFPSCPYLFYDFLILHLDKLRLSTPTMSRYAIRTVRPPPSSFPRIPTPVEDGDRCLPNGCLLLCSCQYFLLSSSLSSKLYEASAPTTLLERIAVNRISSDVVCNIKTRNQYQSHLSQLVTSKLKPKWKVWVSRLSCLFGVPLSLRINTFRKPMATGRRSITWWNCIWKK